MQNFIYNICDFIWRLLNYMAITIYNFIETQGVISNRIRLDVTAYNDFLDKQIFIGDLLSVGMTWRELLLYILPLFLTFLFITLIVRFIWSLLTIIKDSTIKWR